MPYYFFHVVDGVGYAADDEGRELPGLDAARREAILGARSILSEEVKAGRLDLRGRIEVADAEGRALLTVRFDEAVELVTGDLPASRA